MWLAFLLFGCLSLFLFHSVCSLLYLRHHDSCYLLLSPKSVPASPCFEISDQFENEATVASQKKHGDCKELIKKKKRNGCARRKRRKERPSLPKDIWMEILLRLPGTSLLRCKLVCKSWYHLISDSSFVLKHLSEYTCNLKVLSPLLFADTQRFSFIALNDYNKRTGDGDSMSVTNVASFIGPGNLCSKLRLHYFGHCLGIIFLYDFRGKSGRAALWNPATRDFRILPRSPLTSSSSYGPIDWVGLGYDALTNDFKVVQARSYLRSNDYAGAEPPIELYKSSTHSWKTLSVDRELVTPNHCRCCMVEGCLWWPMINRVSDDPDNYFESLSLLRFDLNSEVFLKIMPPEDLQDARDDMPWPYVLALDKRVALILFDGRNAGIDQYFDIWVMEESGVDISWSKILSIGPVPGYMPIAFCGENKFLLINQVDWAVILYELSTRKIKRVKLPNVGRDFVGSHIVIYKDSLLKISN